MSTPNITDVTPAPSKPRVLDDFLTLAAFAAEVGRCPRTIARWLDVESNPLPHTRLGNQVLVHVPSARQWLLDKMRRRRPNARRAKTKTKEAV